MSRGEIGLLLGDQLPRLVGGERVKTESPFHHSIFGKMKNIGLGMFIFGEEEGRRPALLSPFHPKLLARAPGPTQRPLAGYGNPAGAGRAGWTHFRMAASQMAYPS